MLPGDDLFRWFLPVILLANLAISATYRRRARRAGEVIQRGAESPGLILARVGIALPTLALLVIFIVAPGALGWSRLPLTGPWVSIRWLGAGLGLAAIPMVWWTLSSLGSNVSETVLTKESHRLVTSGPYRWIRHPLYTAGAFLLLPGLALMAASWVLLVLCVVTVVVVRLVVVPREEAALVAKFGVDYESYRARTGAIVPRLP